MRLASALALAALVGLAGCKTAADLLEGPKVDYKSAGTLPSLEVPPDLTSPARDNRYVVPETGRSAATLSGYQADRGRQPKPGETGILPTVSNMRVERSGSQRWLVVNEPADKLWPLVKDFWQENGFLVNLDLPETGVMETDWAENRAKIPQDFIRATLGKLIDQVYSTPERDKFRTRLERGSDPNVTEIYISHRGMIEIYITEARSATMWQPRNPDPELEAEFLRRLMIRLGVQEEKAKQFMASSPQQLRAAMVKGVDGAELLDVFEPFDRAWRRVGLALDRVGFTVEDRDRQKGVYFVRYADADRTKPKEKPGFLDRFAFWKSDEKIKTEQYRVQVKQGAKQGAESSEVLVLNKDGAVEQSQTTKRILTLLHEQLK
jgi:outer membrane protein assembly factor BamC